MRRRKIFEATAVFWLASLVCICFLGEYMRAVGVGVRNSSPGLFIAMFSGLAISTYHVVLSMRFHRAGCNGAPWMPGLRGQPAWWRWILSIPLALWLIDLSLRAYQWSAGVEVVHLAESFIALFTVLSPTPAIESLYSRRWLLSLP